jgi:hypothetical protein
VPLDSALSLKTQPRAPSPEGVGLDSRLLFSQRSAQHANLLTVNPNQWGVVAGDPLSLCMNVRHIPPRLCRQLKMLGS